MCNIDSRELSWGLCDDLEGGMREGGRGPLKRDGITVNIWIIHVVVQQKPTQHCKAIIFQKKKRYLEGEKPHLHSESEMAGRCVLPFEA